MKTFLETWLLTAPAIFKRELSGKAEFVPAAELPSPATAVSLAASLDDASGSRFTVAADLAALHGLLVEAGLVGPEPDSQRDSELWRRLLEEAAAAAAQAFGGLKLTMVGDGQWFPGAPSAAYELCLGDAKMRLAFIDNVDPRSEPRETAPPAPRSAGVGNPSTGIPPGIDLLLDVELEASLRFGSCEMSLNEVFELGPGDVVELDRHVADPVDLLVGDKIVARGEVVLVNGSFGLRVLEVAEPRKCLESIRCLF